jgi:hypothetical protein
VHRKFDPRNVFVRQGEDGKPIAVSGALCQDATGDESSPRSREQDMLELGFLILKLMTKEGRSEDQLMTMFRRYGQDHGVHFRSLSYIIFQCSKCLDDECPSAGKMVEVLSELQLPAWKPFLQLEADPVRATLLGSVYSAHHGDKRYLALVIERNVVLTLETFSNLSRQSRCESFT